MLRKRSNWTGAAARRLLKAAGNPPTIEAAIRIIVSKFIEDVPCPPTDLDVIMPRLNISGVYSEDLPISGELRRNGNGLKIVCSSLLSPMRRRFTIAHEMGHAIFEKTGRNCPRSGEQLERLCDMLATEILMPTSIFLNYLGPKPSLKKIFELSNLFNTSLTATAIRCSELGRVSVLEVSAMGINWSYGAVRKVEGKFKTAVSDVLSGKSVNEVLYLDNRVWDGKWEVEGAPIGKGDRALFLLQPLKSTDENLVEY